MRNLKIWWIIMGLAVFLAMMGSLLAAASPASAEDNGAISSGDVVNSSDNGSGSAGTASGSDSSNTGQDGSTSTGTVSENPLFNTTPVPVESITISQKTATVQINRTITLSSTISPANATNRNRYWSSDNPAVATVIVGMVTGVAEGTATITVTSEDGNKSDSCIVTVVKPSNIAVTNDTIMPMGGPGALGSSSIVPTRVTSQSGSALVYPSAGGIISLNGEATVDIPEVALHGRERLNITVEKSGASVNQDGLRLMGSAYDFKVDGKLSYDCLKNIKITMKYNRAELGPGEEAKLYCYDDAAGKWQMIESSASNYFVTGYVNHFGRFAVLGGKPPVEEPVTVAPEAAVAAPLPTITDLKKHWASKAINTLINKRILTGYNDGTFRPNRTMTRLEFITAVVKAAGLKPDNDYRLNYVDAGKIPAWASGYVKAAAKEGILPEIWGIELNGDVVITRAEAAYIIDALGRFEGGGSTLAGKFADYIPNWAKTAVGNLVGRQIISGYPNGIFAPLRQLKRAEACVIINNYLQAVGK